MKMTENLFDNIINTAQDCVFWKDKERRFVGVNQAFLDFYNFDSADVLIGKTDEEMGWHSDPKPYMEDELRVLNGHSTYKVPGKCIIRGEERDIIATKRPIYENGEIIGLVGSFVDITDVLKRQQNDNINKNYSVKLLRRYPYFDKLLDDISVNEILDPLTGIIRRRYFLEFVNSLIADKTPFSFTMMDLDNFKHINDNCGHHVGDMTLSLVATKLVRYSKDFCIIGRFGGDELLIVNLRDTDYDSCKNFFEDIYVNKNIFRQTYTIDNYELFLTGTSGCATFPNDADNYDELFALADKTLYHGKNIGRNCYTIYVEEKHKNIDVQSLAKKGIYSNMSDLMMRMQSANTLEEKLESVIGLLRSQMHISDLYYVDGNLRLHSVMNPTLDEDVSDIALTVVEEIYSATNLEDIQTKSPALYEAFSQLNKESIIIIKVGLDTEVNGYLICSESTQRIWQEDECAILYFIAKSLAAYMRLNRNET